MNQQHIISKNMATKMIKTVYREDIKATVVEGVNDKTNVIFYEKIEDTDIKQAFSDLRNWSIEQLNDNRLVYATYFKDDDIYYLETEDFSNNLTFKVNELPVSIKETFTKVGTYCYLSIQ